MEKGTLMNTKFGIVVLMAVAGFSAFADTHEWDPSERRTEFGAATVGYSENENTVTSVAIRSVGEPARETFVGNTPFTFAEDATISFTGGDLGFETPVEGGGISLSFDPSAAPKLVSTDTFDDYLHSKESGTDDLVFPGAKVSDYEFDSAWLDSGALRATVTIPGFVVRTETTLSAQFQAFDSVVKGVRVTLMDSPEGIRAHVDYARFGYASKVYQLDLDDLAAVEAAGGRELPVTRNTSTASGYGVRRVTIRQILPGSQSMTVSNALYSVASAAVGSETKLVLDSLADGSALSNFGIGPLAELRFRNMPEVHVGGTFSAEAGRLAFEQTSADHPAKEELTVSLNEPIVKNTLYRLAVEKTSIDDIVSWSVPNLCNSVSASAVPVMCNVVRTSQRIRFQLQAADDGYVKGCVVELCEFGGRIYVRKLFAAYWKQTQGAAGTVDMEHVADDFFGNRWKTTDNYSPASLTLTCRPDSSLTCKTVPSAIKSNAKVLVCRNADIEDIAFVQADCLINSMSTDAEPLVCFVRRSTGWYEFQLQVEDHETIKGCQIVLYQNGNDIWGYKTMSWYSDKAGRPKPGEMDMTSPEFDYTGEFLWENYIPRQLELICHPRAHMNATVAELGAAQGLAVDVGTNVTLTVGGAAGALPQNGIVSVAGVLSVTNRGSLSSSSINVTTGGVMRISGDNAVALDTLIDMTFDGGTLLAADGLNYMNHPVFMNGANVCGNGELCVGARNLTWAVRGSSSSACAVPIRCVSKPATGEYVMTWDVADVTGDETADFLMNADMADYSGDNGGMIHRKVGAGTLLWNGFSICTGCVQVAEGRLLLGRTNALNPGDPSHPRAECRAKQPLEICGGTLAAAADTTNLVDSVSLGGTGGAIDLADGAVLAADSVGVFEDGVRLTVTLGEGAAFRVGQRLTAAQLRAIRVNGYHAQQDESGALFGEPQGIILIVR